MLGTVYRIQQGYSFFRYFHMQVQKLRTASLNFEEAEEYALDRAFNKEKPQDYAPYPLSAPLSELHELGIGNVLYLRFQVSKSVYIDIGRPLSCVCVCVHARS